ncbi:hypothetical protein CRG98_043160 [Punica granatum]|uniref:Uncharacterized protein n=1 Tax=Punica granatum TaxID=22663 RepID=A0A2I0HXM7_PUNGR|nr:hypothetical protein CRG98_043160 [Punica granatum]
MAELPEDVIFDILTRLPIKPLTRLGGGWFVSVTVLVCKGILPEYRLEIVGPCDSLGKRFDRQTKQSQLRPAAPLPPPVGQPSMTDLPRRAGAGSSTFMPLAAPGDHLHTGQQLLRGLPRFGPAFACDKWIFLLKSPSLIIIELIRALLVSNEVMKHLYQKGFKSDYWYWTNPGGIDPNEGVSSSAAIELEFYGAESSGMAGIEHQCPYEAKNEGNELNRYKDMVYDIARGTMGMVSLTKIILMQRHKGSMTFWISTISPYGRVVVDIPHNLFATGLMSMKVDYNLPQDAITSLLNIVEELTPDHVDNVHNVSRNHYKLSSAALAQLRFSGSSKTRRNSSESRESADCVVIGTGMVGLAMALAGRDVLDRKWDCENYCFMWYNAQPLAFTPPFRFFVGSSKTLVALWVGLYTSIRHL